MISISYTFNQNLSIPITKAYELMKQAALADVFQTTEQLSATLS